MQSRVLGRTGIEVTSFGLGCAMLGVRMGEVNERTGVEVVATAMKAGVTLLDVAPVYPAVMSGMSERIVGQALKENPDLAKKVVLETKVGHLPEDFDYTYDSTMRGVAGSLERLQVDHIPMIYIHDAPREGFDRVMGKGGTLEALRKLQSEGVIGHIGTASNLPENNIVYIETGEFESAVIPEFYSLLNQLATERVFPAAEKFNMGLVVATPYETGLLAVGVDRFLSMPERDTRRRFSAECLEHVRDVEAICARYGVSIAAASLQYLLRHSQVTAVIPSARDTNELRANLRASVERLPDEFWAELTPILRHWDADEHRWPPEMSRGDLTSPGGTID